MRNSPRVMAMARPGALPVPADRKISALTMPSVLDRWSEDAAGLRALAQGDATITMFDVIGEDFWSGGGITAKSVASQLRAIGDRPVEVQVNSPGGDMFEGIAIYNVLREHAQPVTIKVMGMAASAASIVAMAGDRVEIGAASFLMIHNCWVMAIGNRHDMAETSEWLAPFDQAMAEVYAARSGRSAAECAKWMDAESYMSGSVAIERGFADALLPADQVKVDDDAKAREQSANKLRSMELTLVSAGMSRSQARARINEIKGTPGAAPDDGTPGAAGDQTADIQADLTSLLAAVTGR
ncbi:head maturation protease, ClpP-related [Novosphingobium gossypii]|uniref:head maturation protease, ClpP-related n=1 Tax=Novosphingobium gossypii TaxID=1604774 RepID=UPI003D1C7B5A